MHIIKSASYFNISVSLPAELQKIIEGSGILTNTNNLNFSEKRKKHNEMCDRPVKIIDGKLVTSILFLNDKNQKLIS